MNAVAIHSAVATLPHAPASDVKKLGWRGVMQVVTRNGKLVVTHHNRPEAVILPAAEYERMLALLQAAGEKDRQQLDALRQQFDARLACLNAPGADDALRGLLRKPLALEGQVIAGDTC